MTLPVGAWNIVTDTLGSGTLSITSVDASGNVAGSISIPSSAPIVGFFDATAQSANLATVTDPTTEFYVFSAPVFQVPSGSTKTSTTTESVLAGTYAVFPPGVAAAASGRWVASLNQKVKEKDKEEKEKEAIKDQKDVKDHKEKEVVKEIEKVHPDILPLPTAQDVGATLQHFALRLDAIEQRLGTGQSFIGGEERPDVGGGAMGSGDAG
jgi:hypothetical protein